MHVSKDSMWRGILKSFWILGGSKQGQNGYYAASFREVSLAPIHPTVISPHIEYLNTCIKYKLFTKLKTQLKSNLWDESFKFNWFMIGH